MHNKETSFFVRGATCRPIEINVHNLVMPIPSYGSTLINIGYHLEQQMVLFYCFLLNYYSIYYFNIACVLKTWFHWMLHAILGEMQYFLKPASKLIDWLIDQQTNKWEEAGPFLPPSHCAFCFLRFWLRLKLAQLTFGICTSRLDLGTTTHTPILALT